MRLRENIGRALMRLRSEHGFAVPTVMMAVVIGLGLGGAAVISSIYSQRGTVRDSATKRAVAVAEAGAEVALYRQNKIVTTDTLRCLNELPGELIPGLPLGDGWCAPESGTVEGGSYEYRVKPWTLTGTVQTGLKRQLKVVSVGTVDGVSRRIALTAGARTGANIFGGSGAVGLDGISIEGSAGIGTTDDPTDASTNGNVTTEGSAQLCGNAHVGTGYTFAGSQCPGYGSDNVQISLPPVDPGNVWDDAVNDNDRFFDADVETGEVGWDAATRTLTLGGSGRLTLGGSNYSLCRLDLQGNSQIIVAQGAVVNLFFHSPETCAAETGLPASDFTSQITMNGNPRFNTTSLNAGDLRIMMVGSDEIPTSVVFQGNPKAGGNDFTLYAPRTDVTLQGNPTYSGAVAAKTITVDGSAVLVVDDSSLGADLSVALNYARERFVECVGGAMPATPDASC